MDELMLGIIKNLVTQSIGFGLAAVFAWIAWQRDQQVQRLSRQILRSAMAQTKDALRQEQAIAILKQLAEYQHTPHAAPPGGPGKKE